MPKQASKQLVKDARKVAETCVGLNIRAAERRIARLLETRLQESRLNLAQFALLVQIAAARDDTIGALTERTGLDQSTLSRNLRSLERAGLIEIALVEGDLRRRAVWLTETGARRLEAAIPVWRKTHEVLSRVIDARVIRRLAAATLSIA